jgi:hypothetical protein
MPTICKTLPLTLSLSRDSDRAVSLRPKEINCFMSFPYGLLKASSDGAASLATVFPCSWLSVRESRRVNNQLHFTFLAIRRQPHSLFERWPLSLPKGGQNCSGAVTELVEGLDSLPPRLSSRRSSEADRARGFPSKS